MSSCTPHAAKRRLFKDAGRACPVDYRIAPDAFAGEAQRSCDVIDLRVKDTLICPKGYCLTPWEKAFVQQLEQVQEEICRQDGPPHPAGQAF